MSFRIHHCQYPSPYLRSHPAGRQKRVSYQSWNIQNSTFLCSMPWVNIFSNVQTLPKPSGRKHWRKMNSNDWKEPIYRFQGSFGERISTAKPMTRLSATPQGLYIFILLHSHPSTLLYGPLKLETHHPILLLLLSRSVPTWGNPSQIVWYKFFTQLESIIHSMGSGSLSKRSCCLHMWFAAEQ